MSETGGNEIGAAIISAIVSFIVARVAIRTQRHDNLQQNVCRRIEELEGKGRIYWQNDGRQDVLAEDIITLFQFLSQDVEQLFKSKNSTITARQQLNSLNRAITGGTFDSSVHKTDKDRREQIRDAAAKLRASATCC